MFAGREFNYYGFKDESLYGSMAQGIDDYFAQRTKNIVKFDMETLYPNDPKEKVRILQEIYDTERSYVLALTIVDEVFFTQLSLACPKAKKHLRTMFGEISAICKTHQILLDSLRKKPIAEAFTKLIPFLKLYTSYASHYPNALKVYAKLMARNDFRRALARIEEDPKCEGKNLQAYLIMPVQRIPRYILLIQNLMHFSTRQEDMTSLFKALSGMQGLSEQIQSCMTAYENGERLLDIQLNFGLDGHILEPGRVLLKEGMLYKRELNGTSNYQEVVVFLFNDILLYGIKRISVMPLCKYEPSAILSLRHCDVQYDEICGSIFIRCGEVGIDFTAYPMGGVTEWYKEIVDAIENAKKLRDTLRKESFKQKSLVFDRGFWQRNRDRLRNMITADVTAHVNRVLSRKKPLPRLDESDFLRGQWTTPSTTVNRKRKTVTLENDDDASEVKRVLKEDDINYVTLSQPATEPNPSSILRKSKTDSKKSRKSTRTSKVMDDDDSDEDFVWSDDEEYIPEEKKIPLRRVVSTSFDEEDRRPRTSGNVRRSMFNATKRCLGVEDIRKLSYQHRPLEPFDMNTDDDDEEEDIEVRVKGERPRPWWETESAPPAIKNQKSSLIESVKNSCSIM